jgi:diguanylate cyclase (GGDEF)-like protein
MSEEDVNIIDAPPLSEAAVGAIAALIRVCELYDPAVAHRAALRATIASMLVDKLGLQVDRNIAIASSALADIDLVVSRPADPEAAHDPTRSLLGSTIVRRVPGLRAVADAVGHQRERWDGTGSPSGLAGEEIPIAARVVAITDALVANPAAGFIPTWSHALRRVDSLASSELDPALCTAVAALDLDSIVADPIPSSTIVELLEEHPGDGDAFDGATTATTIRSAVAAAGHANDLLALFAESARRTIGAAEVVVMRLTETQLDPDPVARAVDGHRPALSLDRLDDLREFSTQAELRAGASIERSTSIVESPEHLDELIMPIVTGEESWGIIVATRRADTPSFDPHDQSILRHIAAEAAEAVTSTAHWAQMERMALRDQLTGLANRHELYRVLDAIFERPPLERIDCALIMCDVDGLKVVNDTMGHQAGDRLLIDAAAALRGSVRDAERTTICRIGGDEFCLVIDGGGLLTAHDVSDMIERLFARSAGSGPPRSISCGIAFASEDVESRSALLRAADENQYQTKRARKAARAELIEQVTAQATTAVERRAIRD